MGRSKPSAKAVKPAEEEVPREPVKVSNLYESGALKTALDEVARETVTDQGYDEDIVINNAKILLGLAAIGAAAFSHYGPGKFPGNWWMVFSCVITYLLLTFALNLYSWKMEGEAFLVTKPFGGSKGLRVSSRMARLADEYLLVLTDRADATLEVTLSIRVPDYFHADGYLADAKWRTEVEELCKAFRAKVAERTAKKQN